MENLNENKMTVEEAKALLSEAKRIYDASLIDSKANQPFEIQTVTLDLSTAKLESDPYIVRFPFKSVYIQSASSSVANIEMKIGTRDSYQSPINLKRKDSLEFDQPITEAYIHWSAQASGSITLVFFVSGKVSTGTSDIQLLSNVEGSVINDNVTNAVTTVNTALTISAPSWAVINIYNEGPSTVYIGGVSNSSTTGMPIPAGSERQYKNSGIPYACTSSGTATLRVQTEV